MQSLQTMKPLRLTAATVLLLYSSLAQAQGAGARPAHVQHAKAPAPLRQTTAIARAWAQQRNLPVREIEVGPPERRVTRLFVPVKPDDLPNFVQTFGNQTRSLLLKLKGNDSHLIAVSGGEEYLWARNLKTNGWQWYGTGTMTHDGPNGPAIVVELNDAESTHVKQWFDHRNHPNDALYGTQCGAACMDFIGNIEVAPAADGTNTLRTIPAQEIQRAAAGGNGGKGGPSAGIPAGKKLFDILGIARSKDGRNMTYNLVHAAGDRVQVIGVPLGHVGAGQMQQQVVVENGRRVVKNVMVGGDPIEHFLKMPDAELLGPLPPQGVAAVVRPVK